MNKFFLAILLLLSCRSFAASIILHKKDAAVWYLHQKISGTLIDLTASQVKIHQGQTSFTVPVTENNFVFQVVLQPGDNRIWVEAVHAQALLTSDTINLTLMYKPAPVVVPSASVDGDKVILRADVIENPYGLKLKYYWSQGRQNPAPARIIYNDKATTTVEIPEVPGKFYFDLTVVSGKDSSRFQTLVLRDKQDLRSFSVNTDYSEWINNAVTYEITPYKFVRDGSYDDIRDKLPELKMLGINTLWLQPVFKTNQHGQGYDVVDYFSLRTDLGTEDQLRDLIQDAKGLDMRVLFDIVPNHTSIHHPYAKDCAAFNKQSHYYDFYQHEFDGAPYSSFYHKDEKGFVYYFWEDLVNLNYNNEEVQRWMIEVCKYWLLKFDLDGYRLDAVWGVNARMPSFGKRLRTELKSIKPGILLLAEDKGADAGVYEKGFDAAYDWTADSGWVSQWSWQYEYHERDNRTIFNFRDVKQRGKMLSDAIFRNGNVSDLRLRFMENNDLPRFIQHHNLRQTKMVAALLFSLPGIPMIYNGQETGFTIHPYSKGEIFKSDQSIRAMDTTGLFDYYQKIIALRKKHASLTGKHIAEVSISPDDAVVAFHRWSENENILVIINMDSLPASVKINSFSPGDFPETGLVKDMLTGTEFPVSRVSEFGTIPMEGYSVRWLLF